MKQLKRSVSLILVLTLLMSMVYLSPVVSQADSTATTYAANLSVRTTKVTNLMTGASADSAAKYTLPAGTMLTVKALYDTGFGYWYQVLYYDTTLYVDASAATMVDHLTGDITVTDLMTPAALGLGNGFPLKGTIRSSLNKLGTVTAAVHHSSNINAAPAILSTDSINGNSYTMDDSALDYNLIFSDLAAGSYTFMLTVEAISYYIDDSGQLATSTQTVVLDNKPCIVTDASNPNPIIAKGIDVSFYQGNVNWASVAGQVDFAILRLGYATTMDSKFTTYASDCNTYGVPFGIYLYSYAENTTEALQEANFVISSLKNYDVSLPVFYDFEDECQASLSAASKQAIVNTFCDTVKAAGYDVGLYTFLSWFNSAFTDSYYSSMPKWVAQIQVSQCSYARGLTCWQYSWTGSVSGISGNVDCDYWYGEFPGKSTDTSYLANCSYYPSHLTVTVNADVNMRQYPSTGHSLLENLVAGTQLEVTGVYKNPSGEYWYQVNRNGVTGYIHAAYADVTRYLFDDISVIDPTMAKNLDLNSGYYLQGTVHSLFNDLKTVYGKVYKGEDTLSTPVLSSSESPNAKKYKLVRSRVCDNLIFSDLETGYYTYEVSADVANYYVSNGALASKSENVVVWTAPFTVGNASIESDATVCSHVVVTDRAVAATCTEPGLSEGSHCSICGTVFTAQAEIPALGHTYTSAKVPATCQDYEKLQYTCGNCGDTYSIYAHELTAQWSETKPEGVDESKLETKTQYRYSDYEVITSDTKLSEDYTLLNKAWLQSATGTNHYVNGWPAGFDTGNVMYTKYDNEKLATSTASATKTEVGSSTVAGYIYWHWCRGTYTAGPINRTTSQTQDSTHTTFHAFFDTIDPATLTTASDTSVTLPNADCCKDTHWYYNIPVYAQSYTKYKAQYTYEHWTDFSEWSDTAVTAGDNRQVETRTIYRYIDAQLGDHSYVEGVCQICGKATVFPTITPKYPSVSFIGEIQINIYFTAQNLDNATGDMGLLVWNTARSDGTIDNAIDIIPGATLKSDGTYCVHTNGIAAKNLGDTLYFKIYVKMEDGSYAYSAMFSTSAKAYAMSLINNSTDPKIRALAVAMLNYGAAAQTHFSYKPYSLMNAGLTQEQKNLVIPYDSGMVDPVVSVDSSKVGSFVYNADGFKRRYPSVLFEGAFSINYYFTPALPVEGDMTLYYWKLSDYHAAQVLTPENATGHVVMTVGSNGAYEGMVEDIAAKELDQTVFVAGVYTFGGVTYTTGVLPYSLGAYCVDWINTGSGTMQALATQTAIYGYYAKQYFAG